MGGDQLHEILLNNKPTLLEIRDNKLSCSDLIVPIISKIEDEFNNCIKIMRIEYETHREFLQKFKVENVPSILMLKNGKIVKQIDGTISRRNLQNLVLELLSY